MPFPLSGMSSATVGGTAAIVNYIGLTPSSIGLYQVNFVVPNVAAGDHPSHAIFSDAHAIRLNWDADFTMPDSEPDIGRVFLCHSSTDKAVVRELYDRLRNSGAYPWLDEEDLIPGQDWHQKIEQAIRVSGVIVVLLSRASTTKTGYVNKEIRFALDVADEQPDGAIFVIPARLEDCEIPARLRRWQWVNLYEPNGFEKLLRALQAKCLLRPPDQSPLQAQLAPANDSKQVDAVVFRDRLATKGLPLDVATSAGVAVAGPIGLALTVLRDQTRFLWLELVELPYSRDEFVSEIKEKTFNTVKAALDNLVRSGHLRYSVGPAYAMTTDGSSVLKITVNHLTTQLKNVAREIEANSPLRNRDRSDSSSGWEPYGDS
jgi:hypothetical protein